MLFRIKCYSVMSFWLGIAAFGLAMTQLGWFQDHLGWCAAGGSITLLIVGGFSAAAWEELRRTTRLTNTQRYERWLAITTQCRKGAANRRAV